MRVLFLLPRKPRQSCRSHSRTPVVKALDLGLRVYGSGLIDAGSVTTRAEDAQELIASGLVATGAEDAQGMMNSDLVTTRAEDAQRTPTRSHTSPSILVYEDKGLGIIV